MIKVKNINDIQNIYQNSRQFNTLQDKFYLLDQLNNILKEVLPIELSRYCHIGAVDETKNLLILFITNSTSANLIKSLGNKILQTYTNHGFMFDGIITRITIKTEANNSTKYRRLTPKEKQQLEKLAILIGKPELIIDKDEEPSTTPKEIEF
mgnify:CR=1 FL=1